MIPIYLIFLIKIARSHYKFNFHYCYVNFYFSILPSICAQFATINVKKFFAIRNCFIVRFRKYIHTLEKIRSNFLSKTIGMVGQTRFPTTLTVCVKRDILPSGPDPPWNSTLEPCILVRVSSSFYPQKYSWDATKIKEQSWPDWISRSDKVTRYIRLCKVFKKEYTCSIAYLSNSLLLLSLSRYFVAHIAKFLCSPSCPSCLF